MKDGGRSSAVGSAELLSLSNAEEAEARCLYNIQPGEAELMRNAASWWESPGPVPCVGEGKPLPLAVTAYPLYFGSLWFCSRKKKPTPLP